MQVKKSKTALPVYSSVLISAVLCAVIFVSCKPPVKPEYIIPYQNLVTNVSGGGSSTKIVALETDLALEDLNNANVYVVRVNRSNSTVGAAGTGKITVLPQDPLYAPNVAPAHNRLSSVQGDGAISSENPLEPEKILRKDSPRVAAFNANPPPYPTATANTAGILRSVTAPSRSVSGIGSTKKFWVEDGYVNATVRASGTTCNVWIPDSSYDNSSGINYVDKKLTEAQAKAVAAKFDSIYGYATNLLGYEYGGPATGGTGGIDGDPRIQILVYDNSEDNVVGYFYSADAYSQAFLNQRAPGIKSNEAEMFYMSVWFLDDDNPELAYSTLVHEFQHMINFNRKTIQKGLNASMWYNEMLSMLAEDVMDERLNILNGRPVSRINEFLGTYALDGVTQWSSYYDVTAYYARAYAFGAYLLRNFGGAALLQEMLANSSVDEASITQALQKKYNSSMNFSTALSRYGEALLLSGAQKTNGVFSFDNTVIKTINGKTYSATAFDVWARAWGNNPKGPRIYPLSLTKNLPPTSILLQSDAQLTGVSGTVKFEIKLPENRSVDFYVIVRNNLP